MELEQTIERIQLKCKEKGITVAEMLRQTELHHNLIVSMKLGRFPTCEKIVKIALYLEVTTDYLLLGRE